MYYNYAQKQLEENLSERLIPTISYLMKKLSVYTVTVTEDIRFYLRDGKVSTEIRTLSPNHPFNIERYMPTPNYLYITFEEPFFDEFIKALSEKGCEYQEFSIRVIEKINELIELQKEFKNILETGRKFEKEILPYKRELLTEKLETIQNEI
jgi:hypothetical protein